MIQIGPKSKSVFTQKVNKTVNLLKYAMYFAFFLPFVIYGAYHFKLLPSKSVCFENSTTPSKSVALISSYDNNGELLGTGSGCLMSPNLLITNKHVIDGHDFLTVEFNAHPELSGIEIRAHELYSPKSDSESMDYAVIRLVENSIPVHVQLSPLKWGNSDNVKNGDLVRAYGYPGLGATIDAVDFSITAGIVSNRALSIDTAFMKLNCNIFPGNSGGPTLNEDDEVVAINTLVTLGEFSGQALSIKINHILEDPIIQSINWSGEQPLELEK